MGERKQALLSRHNIIISAFVLYFFFLRFFSLSPPPMLINMQVCWRRHQKSFPVHRVGLTVGWGGRLGAMAAHLYKHTATCFFLLFFLRWLHIHLSPTGTDELLVHGLPQQTRLIGRHGPENTAKNNPGWRLRHSTTMVSHKSYYDAALRKEQNSSFSILKFKISPI